MPFWYPTLHNDNCWVERSGPFPPGGDRQGKVVKNSGLRADSKGSNLANGVTMDKFLS